MNEITFKVAPHGEGKTKWLLNIAKHYADKNTTVYLFTEDDWEYVKFCEKYFNLYKTICPVKRVTSYSVTDKDVVLVDNLFKHTDHAIGDYAYVNRNCYKMFVTIEGTTDFSDEYYENPYEQLKLDLQEVLRA